MEDMIMHDFEKQLAQAEIDQDLPWLIDFYKWFFPDFQSREKIFDLTRQKWGIDTIIHTKTNSYNIDEKFRESDYGDMLLEYISNDSTKALGWVEKPSKTDYIAYVVKPKHKVIMLPAKTLREIWLANKSEWLARYESKSCKNQTYNSHNCPVPYGVLFNKLLEESYGKT